MQSNKIRNEKCDITTNREKNQENSKAVLQNLYFIIMENLKVMDNCLNT